MEVLQVQTLNPEPQWPGRNTHTHTPSLGTITLKFKGNPLLEKEWAYTKIGEPQKDTEPPKTHTNGWFKSVHAHSPILAGLVMSGPAQHPLGLLWFRRLLLLRAVLGPKKHHSSICRKGMSPFSFSLTLGEVQNHWLQPTCARSNAGTKVFARPYARRSCGLREPFQKQRHSKDIQGSVQNSAAKDIRGSKRVDALLGLLVLARSIGLCRVSC